MTDMISSHLPRYWMRGCSIPPLAVHEIQVTYDWRCSSRLVSSRIDVKPVESIDVPQKVVSPLRHRKICKEAYDPLEFTPKLYARRLV
jgi:hypothetical protein